MTLTEEEAKTKWCPYARVMVQRNDGEPTASANRMELVVPPSLMDWPASLCIASQCMAWQWLPPNDGSCAGDKGYCGLTHP